MKSIHDRDLLIGWSLLPFLHPRRLRALYERFDPLKTVHESSLTEISVLLTLKESDAALVRDPLQLPSLRRTVERCREHVVTRIDPDYPSLLEQIGDAPAALFLQGDRSLLRRPAVAVVGSRNASRYALAAAEHFSRELASRGITVVSGLARGIDGAAHQAALGLPGSTIAVLGTGLDIDYPRANLGLKRRLGREALLITELPAGTPARAHQFPVRNRIIAGLAKGTLVVEATGRSGSLITARLAAEQGREVFAVPGPIFSPGSEGPNRLIQYGAKLVHEIDDLLDELRLEGLEPKASARMPSSPELCLLLEVFTPGDPLHVDTLAAQLGRPVASLAEGLFTLEIDGFLRALPGARYVRTG